MSNLNDFYNNNSNGNNNNNNNTDSINDFFNTSPNQELEIEDTRNLVDAPDLNYKKEMNDKPSRQINDNSNIINQNNLGNAKFEREYNFDDGTDKKTIIKNIILISIVVIVGFFIVYNYTGVKDPSPQQETPIEGNTPVDPNTPVEPSPQPDQSTPASQDQPVVQEDGTVTHQDDEVYLEVSTSRMINGSGIEQIGKERFYKTDINKEINSNGVSFTIKKVNNKGVTIVLNTELVDTTSSVGCRRNYCTVGTEIYLDGKITVIFETPEKENKTNYSFNVYNIKY